MTLATLNAAFDLATGRAARRTPKDYAGTTCSRGHPQGPGLCVVEPWYSKPRRRLYWRKRCLACRLSSRVITNRRRQLVPRGGPLRTCRLLLLAAASLREPFSGAQMARLAVELWPARFAGQSRKPVGHAMFLIRQRFAPKGWAKVIRRSGGRPGHRYCLTDAGRVELERLRGLLGDRPLRDADRLNDVVRRKVKQTAKQKAAG